jgi:hypothetical protein
MGHRPAPAIACIVGLFVSPVLAGRAAAQELPGPGSPGEEEAAAGTAVEVPIAGLQINASLGGGWDSNASFQPDGASSATAFGQAGLARTWLSPKWTTVGNIGGGGSLYQTSTTGNRYQIGAGLNTTGRLGTLTTLTVGAGGGIEYTDFLSDPATDGLVLPLTRTRRLQGQMSLTRALGVRTQLTVGGDYGRYFFESEDLADTEGITASAGLTRTIGLQTSFTLGYGFQANRYEQNDRSQIHTLALGVGRTLSTRTSLSISAGVDRRTFEEVASRWTFSGNAAFNLQGRRTSLSLGLRRGVAPGPGLGQDRILNMISLVLTSTLRPWATLTLSGSRGLNQDPVDPELDYSADSVNLGLSLRLSQSFGLTPQLRYRRRGEVGVLPAVSTFRVGLALDYSRLVR